MKYIIITGVTNGLGREILKQLSDDKNKLYLIGRNIYRVKEISEEANLYEIDFSETNFDKVNKLYEDIEKDISDSDEIVFINCAGIINPINLVENLENEEMITNINVNILWPVILIKEIIKINQNIKSKVRIINISSGVAYNPLPGWALYSMAKASINVYLETISKEKRGYKIVSIDPGVMDTKMQAYIRNIDIKSEEFNYISNFKKYKDENVLALPKDVASCILEKYVYEWTAKELYEKILIKSGK